MTAHYIHEDTLLDNYCTYLNYSSSLFPLVIPTLIYPQGSSSELITF